MNFEGIDQKTIEAVMELVRAATSKACEARATHGKGWKVGDIFVFEVVGDDPHEVKCSIGGRDAMREACVDDGVFGRESEHYRLLRQDAPRGMRWAVIDWGDSVSTLLVPIKADTKASAQA